MDRRAWGYSPRGRNESDTTERVSTAQHKGKAETIPVLWMRWPKLRKLQGHTLKSRSVGQDYSRHFQPFKDAETLIYLPSENI